MPEGAIGLARAQRRAGKTTAMIRTLLGLIRFDSGRGEVLGMGREGPPARHPPGRRLQSPRTSASSRPVDGVRVRRLRGPARRCMSPKDALQPRPRDARLCRPRPRARYRKVDSLFDRDRSSGSRSPRPSSTTRRAPDPRRAEANGMDPAGREGGAPSSRATCRGTAGDEPAPSPATSCRPTSTRLLRLRPRHEGPGCRGKLRQGVWPAGGHAEEARPASPRSASKATRPPSPTGSRPGA